MGQDVVLFKEVANGINHTIKPIKRKNGVEAATIPPEKRNEYEINNPEKRAHFTSKYEG